MVYTCWAWIPDTYILQVSKPGHVTESISSRLNIGQNLMNINFSLDENFALINGTIIDENGDPVEQSFINVISNVGEGASTASDQDGAFTIPRLTSGDYSIEIKKLGFVDIIIQVRINDGDFLTINETLVSKNGAISGVVLDENSTPLIRKQR